MANRESYLLRVSTAQRSVLRRALRVLSLQARLTNEESNLLHTMLIRLGDQPPCPAERADWPLEQNIVDLSL